MKRRCTVETCRLETQCKKEKYGGKYGGTPRYCDVLFFFILYEVGKQKKILKCMAWNEI